MDIIWDVILRIIQNTQIEKTQTFTQPEWKVVKILVEQKLVGGWTNPFEKYARQNGNLPQIGMKITNIWNHQPENISFEQW